MTATPILLRLWVIMWVWLPLSSIAQEQQFSFTQYNIKDGLAGSIVHGMCQDKDGFLWFATETGLSRFDGKRFKNYTTADGLPSNEVLGVLPDNTNKVWILPFKNMIGYYYKGKIYSPTNNVNLTQLQLEGIVKEQGISVNGQVVVKAVGHYLYFDSHGNKLPETYTPSHKIWQYDIDSLVTEIKNDSLHFLQYSHFWMRHQRNNVVEVHKNINNDIVAWLDNKLYVWRTGEPPYRIPIPKTVTALLPLNNTTLALRLSTGGCLLVDIRNQQPPLLCLVEEKINQVLTDLEGNFWFSTNGSGIYKLSSLMVKNYRLYQQKLPGQVINISKWGEHMYIGTDHGQFWQMSPGTSTLEPIKERVAPPGIGPYQHTLARWLLPGRVFNPIPSIYKNEKIDDNALIDKFPVKTISRRGNNILLATAAGVFCISTGTINHMDTVYFGRSTCAIEAGNQFFIGTLEGLYIVESNKRTFYAGDIHPALKGRIGTLGIAPNGTVWIASYSDGLVAWQHGKVVAHITAAQGLTSNNCRSIFIEDNWLWVGTERGLNKIDITGNIPVVEKKLNTSDGLASDMINALYVDGTTVYAGTSAGLSVFDETTISQSSTCRLNMTGIYVSNKPMPIDSGILQLPHASKNIRFEYAGISFRSSDKMLYRYRLLGLDSVWRQTSENVIEFPSLSSGAYEFQLQAVNAYGLASNIINQPFNIKVLLIEKTWFRWVGVLAIGLLIGLLFHFRLRNIRKKERQRVAMNQRLAELEHLALRSQMNPHFIFNSLNAMYQYVMDKDIAGANKFITDFSQLIRLTFELTAQPKITITEELKYLHTYLELERVKYEGQFNYAFSIMPNLNTENYFLPPMILQPYVENCIRHGVRSSVEKGQINITLLIETDFLICTIDDNGIGRQASQEAMRNNSHHQSRGMSLTAERLSIWSRQAAVPIRVEVQDKLSPTGTATGTCVTVYIPIQEALNPY